MANIKVRVGQQNATKVVSSLAGNVSGSLAGLSDTEINNPQNGSGPLQENEEDASSQDQNIRDKISLQKKLDEIEDEAIKPRKKPKSLIVNPQPNIIEEDLERFGSDIFDSDISSFVPNNSIPIPGGYIIGPGDMIEVTLFGSDNSKYSIEVTREGDIYFPGIGPIIVSGLTYLELKTAIKETVSSQQIGVNLSVTLGRLKSIQVFIVGESYQPGSYMISGLSTVTNALFTTGGISESGSYRNIEIKRNGETVRYFDLYDILLKGDTSNDIFLQSGDVIFIPPFDKSVGIAGEVRKPGLYELKDGESLEHLLEFAGGLKSTAHLASSNIERISQSDGIDILGLDLNNIDRALVNLNDGDTININPVLNTMKNVILVSGYAARPGFFEFKEGLKIGQIIKGFDDLLPLSDRNYVLVKRENQSNGRLDFYSVDMEKVINGDDQNNISLKARDEIIVFSKETKELLNDRSNAIPDEDILEYELEELINQCFVIKQKPIENMNLTEGLSNNSSLIPGSQDMNQNMNQNMIQAQNKLRTREDRLREEKLQTECIEDILAQYQPDPNTGKRKIMLEPILRAIKDQASPNEIEKIINVTGNVNFPGQYPFSNQMTVLEAIHASGGLKDTSYLEEIELISFNNSNGYDFRIDRDSISADSRSLQRKITPGMTVHIKGAQKINRTASINGEVYFPGTYILSEGESIIDLIKRAGGLKQNAFLEGAFFQRDEIKKLEKEKITSAKDLTNKEILYQQSRLGGEADLTALLQLTDKLDSAEPTGRLVIKLNDIMDGVKNDVVLRNGDELNIPRNTQSVSVLGEVYVPTTHIYEEGLRFEDYLNLSGGATKLGAPKQIFIIKANGSIQSRNDSGGFFRAQSQQIEPGDTIVVPPMIDDGGARTLRIANDVSQLVYQLAVAAAAVNSLSN